MQWGSFDGDGTLRVSCGDPGWCAQCPFTVGVFTTVAVSAQITIVATAGALPALHISDGVAQSHVVSPGEVRLLQFDAATSCVAPFQVVELALTPRASTNTIQVRLLCVV